MLDDKLIFSTQNTDKKDYASKEAEISALKLAIYLLMTNWCLLSTLGAERQKIEWAIGSVVMWRIEKTTKFMVQYGAAGTGKSTGSPVTIQQNFEGYYSVFDLQSSGVVQ